MGDCWMTTLGPLITSIRFSGITSTAPTQIPDQFSMRIEIGGLGTVRQHDRQRLGGGSGCSSSYGSDCRESTKSGPGTRNRAHSRLPDELGKLCSLLRRFSLQHSGRLFLLPAECHRIYLALARTRLLIRIPYHPAQTLPASFFMNSMTAHANGGTGLNWWKACKSWSSFPTSCASTSTPPMPPIGPDVTGGQN